MLNIKECITIAAIMLCVVAISHAGIAATPEQRTQAMKIRASSAAHSGAIATTSPRGHQLIKASVINDEPAHFTIDVKKFANISVDEEAPTFAVYTSSRIPSTCGDFRKLAINYQKPDKYTRVFNLSGHTEVLEAIDNYGCVVMRNIPPAR
ncbi:MAG: hypothetical protein WC989_00240 [Micavibrio sp.]